MDHTFKLIKKITTAEGDRAFGAIFDIMNEYNQVRRLQSALLWRDVPFWDLALLPCAAFASVPFPTTSTCSLQVGMHQTVVLYTDMLRSFCVADRAPVRAARQKVGHPGPGAADCCDAARAASAGRLWIVNMIATQPSIRRIAGHAVQIQESTYFTD